MAKRNYLLGGLTASFDREANRTPTVIEQNDKVPQQPRDPQVEPKQPMHAQSEQVVTFDYEKLNPDDRQFLLERRDKIWNTMRSSIIAVGQELIQAQIFITDNYQRGTWGAWLQTLAFSESSARNYMQAAKWLEISPTVGVLAPKALYRGAAAPVEIQQAIVKLINDGKSPSFSDITSLVEANKSAHTAPTEKPEDTGPTRDRGGSTTAVGHSDGKVSSQSDYEDKIQESSENSSSEMSTETNQDKTEYNEGQFVHKVINASPQPVRDADDSDDPKLTDSEKSTPLPSELHAANELVAQLRRQFDKTELLALAKLWRATSYDAVKQVILTNSGP